VSEQLLFQLLRYIYIGDVYRIDTLMWIDI